jgi:cytochrome c
VAALTSSGKRRRVTAFIAAILAAGCAQAQTPQSLLQQNHCYLCHADRETKTGPAYVDVAAKYQNKPRAVEVVAATVRKGAHGSGPWHMPPHPEISRTDALTMARYILSLKR